MWHKGNKKPPLAGWFQIVATSKLQRNRAYRAGAGTRAALNAFGRVNVSFAVHFADGGHGAGGFASTAVDANIRIYFVSHNSSPIFGKIIFKLYKK